MGRSSGQNKKSKALNQTRNIVLGQDYSLSSSESVFQDPDLLMSLVGDDKFLDTLVSLAPENITAIDLKKDPVFLEFAKKELETLKRDDSESLLDEINEDLFLKELRDDLILKIKSGGPENVSGERIIYDLRVCDDSVACSFLKEKLSRLKNQTREYLSGDFSKNTASSPIKEELRKISLEFLFDHEVSIDPEHIRGALAKDLRRDVSRDIFSKANVRATSLIIAASSWEKEGKPPEEHALQDQAEASLALFASEEVAGFLTGSKTGPGSLRMISDSILKGETFDDLIYKLKPIFVNDSDGFEKIISKDWTFLDPEYFDYILKRAGAIYIESHALDFALKEAILDVAV